MRCPRFLAVSLSAALIWHFVPEIPARAQTSNDVDACANARGSREPPEENTKTFNASLAVQYGRFIQAAYTMYRDDPTNLTPPPSHDFPAGYQLTAWIHMRDFSFFGSTSLVFYGFIAHSKTEPHRAVLAIRGTGDDVEWWDDFNSVGMMPFLAPNCGNVGMGWENIYKTLEVVPVTAAGEGQQSLKDVGRFAAQVKEHLQRHATRAGSPPIDVASNVMVVTGHSLGAALATLYAAENALIHKIRIQALYTFGSPRMGDQEFVNVFNRLPLESHRVVNQQDIVPKVPGLFYRHVNIEQQFDSTGKVRQSASCYHALATYLSLIDPTLAPDPGCRLSGRVPLGDD
ncbi:MAG: lipase family protein [Beijerinckiaceae bacterium]